MGLASPRNTTHLVKRAQGDDEEPMPGRAHATEDIPAAPEVARPPATARRHTGHGADETPGDRPGRAVVTLTLSAETRKRELTTSPGSEQHEPAARAVDVARRRRRLRESGAGSKAGQVVVVIG